MSTLQTLHKVVDLAERRRDEALAALAQQQRDQQHALDQMAQLQAYAQEAQQRWVTRSSAGVDAAWLHHHRQFMQKIDHALAFQQTVLNSHEQQHQQRQAQVHAAERDLAGLRKYTERKQQAADHLAQRQEQKATDEMALSIHLRQSLALAQARATR